MNGTELRFGNLTPAPRGPTPMRMAVNFAGAVIRAGTHKLAGNPLRAPESVAKSRLAACATCEQHVVQGEEERCLDARCGCFLKSMLLNKVNWASESCPQGKWGQFVGGVT